MKFIIGILSVLFSVNAFSVPNVTDSERFNSFYKYALISNAAYHDKSKLIKMLSGSGYIVTKRGELTDYHVGYFLLTNHKLKKHVIAVRGTSNIDNAMVDIALKLSPNKYTGIKLHQGFALVAGLIYSELLPVLNKDYKINTTGHSLGGAVALILTMYMDSADYYVGKVVTFGQPKVTNIYGSNRFAHLDVTRLVMPDDIVPLVPPLDVMDLMNVDIYWHLGIEIVLLNANNYSQLEGINSMLRTTDFLDDVISEKNIQAHYMSRYINALLQKRINPQRVPYKNSYSVSDFFGG